MNTNLHLLKVRTSQLLLKILFNNIFTVAYLVKHLMYVYEHPFFSPQKNYL